MRTLMFVTALASLATPALAAPQQSTGRVVSNSANENACFGQARGYYARGLAQGDIVADTNNDGTNDSNGTIISDRAQNGTNVSNNDAYIAEFCAGANNNR